MDTQLSALRRKIDHVDSQIIQLLQDRMLIVEQVGIYKKENAVPVLDPDRWQEVLASRIKEGKTVGLNERFIQQLWDTIHEESLRLERSK